MEEKEKKFIERCDHCGKLVLGGHRCYKCHTKVYCGQECYDADLSVHKEICKPMEEMDAWKIRENFRGRKDGDEYQKIWEENAKVMNKNFQALST